VGAVGVIALDELGQSAIVARPAKRWRISPGKMMDATTMTEGAADVLWRRWCGRCDRLKRILSDAVRASYQLVFCKNLLNRPRLVKAQCIGSSGFLEESLHLVGSHIQMQLLIGQSP